MPRSQPPQQPGGFPPDQPGQWGPPSQPQGWGQPDQGYSSPYNQPTQGWQPAPYNQPVQGWQQPVPPPPLQRTAGRPPKKSPKKPMTKRDKIIGFGCLGVIALLLCGVIAAIGTAANANHGTTATTAPTTIVAIPSDTPTATVQAVLPTDTPTTAPTDTPIPSPTATATPRPTPTPTQPIVHQPTPTPTPHCVAVNNNPWCYNFITPGNVIYNPNAAFCDYFQCVSTFWTANHGYVAECANGSYTHSGGVSGACSRDGGVAQTLYSH